MRTTIRSTGSWPLRAACETAGVTRSQGRALASAGLVPDTDLTDADVVALRALTAARGLLFPGEASPANASRSARERETMLRNIVDDVQHDDRTSSNTCALVFPDHAEVAWGEGDIITRVLAAQRDGSAYLVLPVGQWLTDVTDASTRKGANTAP